MSQEFEFYGASSDAERRINSLLRLPATGEEQDWEIEFADYSRLSEMLDLFESGQLDLDGQCALALLILASIDECDRPGDLNSELIKRISGAFVSNEKVRRRMEFFWIELRKANNLALLEKLLHVAA